MLASAGRVILLAWLVAVASSAAAAQAVPPQTPQSGPSPQEAQAGPEAAEKAKPPEETPRARTGFLALPGQILRDQKFFWTRPFHLKRKDMRWTAGALGGTLIMSSIDEPVAQTLGSGPPGWGYRFNQRVGQFSGSMADFGVAGLFYGFGHWRGDQRARNTGLLGFRAISNTVIIVQGIKMATQRQRPARGGVPINESEGYFFTGGNAFPSGHAAQAWALATVVAGQYRHRRWVPPLAYGLATLVSGSRVGARRHFPSDVLVGGLIGYWVGRHALSESGDPAPKLRRLRVVPHSTAGGGAALTVSWQP